jgi:hypothetical protein
MSTRRLALLVLALALLILGSVVVTCTRGDSDEEEYANRSRVPAEVLSPAVVDQVAERG